MTSSPLVSIVIPAFNPRYFREAFASAVSQTYREVEVLVCDDSPGDEIKAIFDSVNCNLTVKARYIRNPRRLGPVANILNAMERAQGELVKVLCDDDRLYPSCVAGQAEIFSNHRQVTLVVGQRQFWDSQSIPLPARVENLPWAAKSGIFSGSDVLSVFRMLPRNILGGLSGALMRRADAVKIWAQLDDSGQSDAHAFAFALYVRLLGQGDLVYLNKMMSIERLHPDQWSCSCAIPKARSVETRRTLELLTRCPENAVPGRGWVRFLALEDDQSGERQWEEINLSRNLASQHVILEHKVGVNSASFQEVYADWLSCRTLSASDRALLPGVVARWARPATFVVVVIDEQDDAAALELTLSSLKKQVRQAARTVVFSFAKVQFPGTAMAITALEDPRQLAERLNKVVGDCAPGQWLYLLRAGDRLTETAILTLEERTVLRPGVSCLYSDEGALLDGASSEPVFKPDFNLDLLRSYPYVGRTLAFACQSVTEVDGFNADFGEMAAHDLLLRLVEQQGFGSVEHVAQLLVESTLSFSRWLALPAVIAQNPRVIEAHLRRLGVAHGVESGAEPLINRIGYLHAEQPLVSIVIAHKDQLRSLERCIESVLEKTTWHRYEVLIVDHGSVDQSSLTWLEGMTALGSDKIRVLHAESQSSYAAIHNAAARHAQGEYLVMLSPCVHVTQGDWLNQMLNHGQRPEVGIVGAKIFGVQGHVLHAGLILGLQGQVGRAFLGAGINDKGYMNRLQAVHNPSAIGTECLMIRKAVLDQAGGFDETFNSEQLTGTDLCLYVRSLGHLVVWTPDAVLAITDLPAPLPLAESAVQADQNHFYARWLPAIARDPAYNVNLSLTNTQFVLEPGERQGWTPLIDRGVPDILGVSLNTGGGHYRVIEPLNSLLSAGMATGRLIYQHPTLVELERQSPDVLVLQGAYSDDWVKSIDQFKGHSNARRVYELDDYLFSVPSQNEHLRNLPGNLHVSVRQAIAHCDRLVVSTDVLADALSDTHTDIRVAPNTLAPRLWTRLQSHRRTSLKPRVGWGGGTSHTGDLRIIAQVVRELSEEVDWVFFGMCPPELRPFLREFHGAVDLELYPAKLASLNLDLALAPLEQHLFNDCKSNLRLLEYGACAYPVICSDTRAYDGNLPCTRVRSNTTQEWLEAIRMHLADPEASYKLGDQLHEVVMRDHLLQGAALKRWHDAWLAD